MLPHIELKNKILEFVRDNPGCTEGQLIDGIGPYASDEAKSMVIHNELERWWIEMVPHYYLLGTYQPRYHGAD